MEDDTPQLEKMYMEDANEATPCLHRDDQVDHMDDASTTTTPTSHESTYKGTNIGVDDAMIPLVDMMICERLHVVDASMDITYTTFSFPCDTLPKTMLIMWIPLFVMIVP